VPVLPTENLLQWFEANKREMPWRNTDDPYKIWISEIMLQQTRVDTVIPYYERFLEAFPTVYDLANAKQQQVLKLWEGLGYYSRGRNLHQASKTVVENYDGTLPSEYKEITSLKGVGPYTASAVLSIAFNKKFAVVDGNVIRVLTRFYGIEMISGLLLQKNRCNSWLMILYPKIIRVILTRRLWNWALLFANPQIHFAMNVPYPSTALPIKQPEPKQFPINHLQKKFPITQLALV